MIAQRRPPANGTTCDQLPRASTTSTTRSTCGLQLPLLCTVWRRLLPSRTWLGAGTFCAHIVVTLRRGANSASARSIADRRRKEKPPLPPLGGRRTCESARSSALPMDARHPRRQPSRQATSHPSGTYGRWNAAPVTNMRRRRTSQPSGRYGWWGAPTKSYSKYRSARGPHSPSAACESAGTREWPARPRR